MKVGRNLLEALLVYCKVDMEKKLNELNNKGKKAPVGVTTPSLKPELPSISHLKFGELETELATNKKLIAMTTGDEDGDEDEGSDSQPSEDNLSEEEMAKIIPI